LQLNCQHTKQKVMNFCKIKIKQRNMAIVNVSTGMG